MIYCIISFLLTAIALSWPSNKNSLQEEYNKELKENLKENQMTEHPVSHSEVVGFTLNEMCEKYGEKVRNLIKWK